MRNVKIVSSHTFFHMMTQKQQEATHVSATWSRGTLSGFGFQRYQVAVDEPSR